MLGVSRRRLCVRLSGWLAKEGSGGSAFLERYDVVGESESRTL